jgi:UDP-N-acetylmuramoylalanine--D-glutamate ligase
MKAKGGRLGLLRVGQLPTGKAMTDSALQPDVILIFGAGREAEARLAHLLEEGGPPAVLMDDDPARARALAERFPTMARAAADIVEAEALLHGRALLLRAPSVRLDHPVVAWAEARGAPHTTFTGWWLAENRDRVAATVTGTKGKSTTTMLLAQILTDAGAPTRAAGNLGVPPKLEPDRPGERFVLEMSSYQLSDAPAAAAVHVITNMHREHLDWHGGFEPYWRAKRRPLELSPPCIGVLHRADAWLLEGLPNPVVFVDETVRMEPDRIVASFEGARCEAALPRGADLGGVRRENLATALAAALATGRAAPEALCAAAARAAAAFPGLPSRQAVIGDFAGRLWVDDALATIPEATLAALERWSGGCVHLVAGGKDRGVDVAPLARWLADHPGVSVHAYGPTGERLATLLGLPPPGGRNFEATIAEAFAASAPGDVILFSPAAATFEPGWSYETRSRIFQEAARRVD